MTSSNKYKILVIEDEANIRSFVETILETNGYQVFTAGSCRQGMLMYSSYCPDLIILEKVRSGAYSGAFRQNFGKG